MKSSWSGALSFGLVNIPVKLYSATVDRALNFKLLDKHGNCPISYQRVCRESGKEVPHEDIVRGYEYEKGDYVVLDDKDFEHVRSKKSETIDIVHFTDEEEIDAKLYEKNYYIEPDKKSAKAYVLLREALRKTKKVGIAKFVLKNREYVAVIKSDDNMLLLHQLHYSDEIKPI